MSIFLHGDSFPQTSPSGDSRNGSLGLGVSCFNLAGISGIPSVQAFDKNKSILFVDAEFETAVQCGSGSGAVSIDLQYNHSGITGYPATGWLNISGSDGSSCDATCPSTCSNTNTRDTYILDLSGGDDIIDARTFLIRKCWTFVNITDNETDTFGIFTIFDWFVMQLGRGGTVIGA